MYWSSILCWLLWSAVAGYAQQKDTVASYDSLITKPGINGPITFLEATPSYPFSQRKLRKFIASHTFFPQGTEHITGKVVLQFDIDKEGKIGAITVERSLHPALDSVAVAMIRRMPRWKPAIHNGRPVNWFYTLPVFFPPR